MGNFISNNVSEPLFSPIVPAKNENIECLINTFETFWNERDIETCTALFTKIAFQAERAPLQKFWNILQIAQQKAFDKTTNQKARALQNEFVMRELQASTSEIITNEVLKEETKQLQRWTREGLPINTYLANPKEAKELLKLHLHHPISYYGHEVRVGAHNDLEIMCNGTYTRLSTILSDLEWKEARLISKKNQSEWNYLPNGLTQREIVSWKTLEPVTRLSEDQVAIIQKRAQKLTSPLMTPSEKPPYVLQIVSSWSGSLTQKYFGLADEVDTTFIQPQHPWLRLITPEGDLYSVGFNWGKTIGASNLAETVQSRFRSPDLWEALPFNTRVVTNIAIDEHQFEKIKNDIEKDQTEGLAFNFITQNCSTYVAHTLKKIGFDVDFHVSLKQLIWRSIPKPVKTAVKQMEKPWNKITRFVGDVVGFITPPAITWLWKQTTTIAATALKAFSNFSTHVILALIGGTKGVADKEVKRGYINHKTNRAETVLQPKIVRLVTSDKMFSDNPTDEIYLPRKVVEWQMPQSSTTYLDGRTHKRFYQQFDPVVHV